MVDLAPESSDGWPTVRIVGSIMAAEPCPSQHTRDGEFIDEEYLSVTVNGGAAVLLSFGCRDGVLTALSTGWVEGPKEFSAAAEDELVVRYDYENYVIQNAVAEGDDQISIALDADGRYSAAVDGLLVGRDVPPGSTTVLHATSTTLTPGDDGNTILSLDYRIRSDRAERASIGVDVTEPAAVPVAEPQRVRLTDGEASGSIEVEIPGRPRLVEGALVADTDGFNAPGVAFRAQSSGDGDVADVVVAAGFVVAAISVALLWPGRHRSAAVDYAVLAVALLAVLPATGIYRVIADDSTSDSGGLPWVLAIFVGFFAWELACFAAAMRAYKARKGRRAGWILVGSVASAVAAFLLLLQAHDGGGLVGLGLMPFFGLTAAWMIRRFCAEPAELPA